MTSFEAKEKLKEDLRTLEKIEAWVQKVGNKKALEKRQKVMSKLESIRCPRLRGKYYDGMSEIEKAEAVLINLKVNALKRIFDASNQMYYEQERERIPVVDKEVKCEGCGKIVKYHIPTDEYKFLIACGAKLPAYCEECYRGRADKDKADTTAAHTTA